MYNGLEFDFNPNFNPVTLLSGMMHCFHLIDIFQSYSLCSIHTWYDLRMKYDGMWNLDLGGGSSGLKRVGSFFIFGISHGIIIFSVLGCYFVFACYFMTLSMVSTCFILTAHCRQV